MPQCLNFISSLKGEAVKPLKQEIQETTTPQSPAHYESPVTSPTRMRSMALKSPIKVADAPPEPNKATFQDKLSLKVQEVLFTLWFIRNRFLILFELLDSWKFQEEAHN